MRTQFLKDNLDKVSSLNDQLWFYVFVMEGMNKDFKRFSDNAKALYTPDLFKDNPYATRINVQISKLPKHQKDNQNVTFGVYFATCYEILSQYIKSIHSTLKSFNSLHYRSNSQKGPEENLQAMLIAAGMPIIQTEIIDTINYLRLRRNHYTHIIESPNAALENFRINTCPSLNAFWSGRSTITALDFTKSLIRDFGVEETFELIKLVRICIQEVDMHVAPLFNINSVISDLIKRYRKDNNDKLKRIPVSKRVKKIKTEAFFSLELTLSDADILAAL